MELTQQKRAYLATHVIIHDHQRGVDEKYYVNAALVFLTIVKRANKDELQDVVFPYRSRRYVGSIMNAMTIDGLVYRKGDHNVHYSLSPKGSLESNKVLSKFGGAYKSIEHYD